MTQRGDNSYDRNSKVTIYVEDEGTDVRGFGGSKRNRVITLTDTDGMSTVLVFYVVRRTKTLETSHNVPAFTIYTDMRSTLVDIFAFVRVGIQRKPANIGD